MVARLAAPIDYKAIDGAPVDLVFLLLSPPDAGAEHLKALAAVSRLVRHAGDRRETARRAQPRRDGRGADGRRGARCRLSRRRRGEEAHLRALEALYASAPINRLFESDARACPRPGGARSASPSRPTAFHAAGAAHGTLYFKMLDDAAFYAANGLVSDRFLLTTAFNLHFTKPMRGGEARRRGALDLAASAACSSPRRGSSIATARNARAAPAPSCARTSRCRGLAGYRAD